MPKDSFCKAFVLRRWPCLNILQLLLNTTVDLGRFRVRLRVSVCRLKIMFKVVILTHSAVTSLNNYSKSGKKQNKCESTKT